MDSKEKERFEYLKNKNKTELEITSSEYWELRKYFAMESLENAKKSLENAKKANRWANFSLVLNIFFLILAISTLLFVCLF